MELATATYEVLGKNKDETIRVKLVLASVPKVKWTAIFNNRASKIQSIRNTTTLILEDFIENIVDIDYSPVPPATPIISYKASLLKSVQDLIDIVDAEISENLAKESLLVEGQRNADGEIINKADAKPKFKKGMVLTHDGLSYDKNFVEKIKVKDPTTGDWSEVITDRIMNYSQFLSKINNNQIL